MKHLQATRLMLAIAAIPFLTSFNTGHTEATFNWYNTDGEALNRGTATATHDTHSITDTIENGKTYHNFRTTGINSHEQETFNIFPNPVIDNLNITKEQYGTNDKVRFVNLKGQVFAETKAGENTTVDLPTGISIMQYQTEKGNISKKILSEGGKVRINF